MIRAIDVLFAILKEWRASVCKGDGRCQKTFSVNKYGFDDARAMAFAAGGYDVNTKSEPRVPEGEDEQQRNLSGSAERKAALKVRKQPKKKKAKAKAKRGEKRRPKAPAKNRVPEEEDEIEFGYEENEGVVNPLEEALGSASVDPLTFNLLVLYHFLTMDDNAQLPELQTEDTHSQNISTE